MISSSNFATSAWLGVLDRKDPGITSRFSSLPDPQSKLCFANSAVSHKRKKRSVSNKRPPPWGAESNQVPRAYLPLLVKEITCGKFSGDNNGKISNDDRKLVNVLTVRR